ncbi:Protein jagged-1a, partial [Ophiophagus hannah]
MVMSHAPFLKSTPDCSRTGAEFDWGVEEWVPGWRWRFSSGPSSSLALLTSSAPSLFSPLQGSGATGVVELQVSLARNEKGILADGRCCRGGQEPPCPVAEPCRTFFRVCLKEYQLRAQPGGPCVLGAASTPVLGGNVFSAPLQKPSDQDGTMVIPFDFAWPANKPLTKLEIPDPSPAQADSSPRISRDLSLRSDLSPKEPGEIRRTEAMLLH